MQACWRKTEILLKCLPAPLGPCRDRSYLSGVTVAHPKVVKSGEEVGSDGEDLRVELGGPRHGGSSRQEDDPPCGLRRENTKLMS